MMLTALIVVEAAFLLGALWFPYWLARRGVWRAAAMVLGWAALVGWFGVFAFWVPWSVLPSMVSGDELKRALNWVPEGQLGIPVLLFGWACSSFFVGKGQAIRNRKSVAPDVAKRAFAN